MDGDVFMDYWVMSVGVLAGGVTALLLLCGVSRWYRACRAAFLLRHYDAPFLVSLSLSPSPSASPPRSPSPRRVNPSCGELEWPSVNPSPSHPPSPNTDLHVDLHLLLLLQVLPAPLLLRPLLLLVSRRPPVVAWNHPTSSRRTEQRRHFP